MTGQIHRRRFLRQAGAVATGGAWVAAAGRFLQAADDALGAPHAEKLGWRLGCQAWSFNDFTFYEAIDKTASLGLHYIEAFPGQRLGKEQSDVKFGEGMSAEVRKDVKKRLADHGVKLVNFGVTPASKPTFDFAKDMGIETIVSEPPFDAFDTLDKLCEEYQINVALHDHPKPSRYWNPETVLKVCKGHSKRIGACCDTGHWMRSDIKPVEAIKMLEGRIISFHLKDLNEYGMKAHDVPFGTGRADMKALLAEVKRQGIKPVFSIEYEYHFGHSLPEIAQCVEYFEKVCTELARG